MQKIQLIMVESKQQLIEMSKLATKILKEHYDPIVGEETNSHMLKKYQSVEGIEKEIKEGAKYYFAQLDNQIIGFLAIQPKEGYMYLSKFYLLKEYRGQGLSSLMFDFVKEQTKDCGLNNIRLNVNAGNNNTIDTYKHFGFWIIEDIRKDVGDGYCVHDYVMQCNICE